MSSGDAALLEAAKKGNLIRVQKLATSENINCRDTQGRNSTPLHLAGRWRSNLGAYDTIHCFVLSEMICFNYAQSL